MKNLKEYKPEEFGANKDVINSLIMEQASDCAAERLKEECNLPFEALVEPDVEDGDEVDEETPTRYKEEYQGKFNELYDEEYARIANEIGFDISAENGIKVLSRTVYITVRLDVESNHNLTDEDVQELISETDYSFSDVGDIKITNTEICGIND